MKLSKPEDVNTEDSTADNSNSDSMPMIESMLSERFGLGPMPMDDTVESNADLLDQLYDRVSELEDRVEELETENEELADALERTWDLLEQADSLDQIRPGDRDP